MRFRLLTRAGVDPSDAAISTTIQTAVSILTLATMFVFGLAIALPMLGAHHGYALGGALALVVLSGLAGLITLLIRAPDHALQATRDNIRRLPILRSPGPRRAVRELVQHVRSLVGTPAVLRATAGWATGNWLFDTACLWVCLAAYGYRAAPGPILAVYAAANLIALIPLTPGGLGIVEGVLVPAVISFGADPGTALIGVLTWRLAEYWLPIPVSAVTYLSLRASRHALHSRPTAAPGSSTGNERAVVHDRVETPNPARVRRRR